MNDEHRLAGFKALLRSHQTNDYYLIETDGDFRLWRDLSSEGKLDHIARDAAYYGMAFEQFAEAVHESVDPAAIEESALRLAMRNTQELYDVEKLLPDDGQIGPAPPLVERVSELLHAAFPNHERESLLASEEREPLFKEMPAGEAAAKGEESPRYGKATLQDLRNDKAKSPTPAKGKDREKER